MVLILLRLHLYLHVKESLFLQPFFQQELAQAMKTLGTSGDARLETSGLTVKQQIQNIEGRAAAEAEANKQQTALAGRMNRQRARGTAGRDSGRDVLSEIENVKAQVMEGLKAAKGFKDRADELAPHIEALNKEIGSSDHKSSAQLKSLDDMIREMYHVNEEEKKVLNDEPHYLINKLAIFQALAAQNADDSQSRNGPVSKNRKQRPAEAPETVDSPGPSPSETRKDGLKRVKGAQSRSSSQPGVPRTGAVPKSDDDSVIGKGVRAEREGQFVVNAEVFYKHPKGAINAEGEGIQCIIKKVWTDKKPIQYDVQDPEPGDDGNQDLHKAVATDLIPIPKTGAHLPLFSVGKHVLARYPETTTFYKAEVMSMRKDVYNLKFEGEEDDKEMEVDKRFVLDLRLK